MTVILEFQKLFDGYVECYRSNDPAGCATYFTDNAELFSPYGPAVKGRKAIEAAHAAWIEEDAKSKAIEVVQADINGHIGWCLARFSEGEADHGTSLNVLYKQPDGRWLITHCSLNETP